MSAVANAEDQGSVDAGMLIVVECMVNEGPRLKRIRPRARGTAFGIKRRLAHIVVGLTDPNAEEGLPDMAPAIPAPVPTMIDAPALGAAPTEAPATPA